MASIGFLIGGALVNALAFSGSNFLFSSLSKESIEKERRDMIKQLKIYNELKWSGLEGDKNDWITLIIK